MSLFCNQRKDQYIPRGLPVLGGVLLSSLLCNTPVQAGDLAAVPAMMTPIYTNTAIQLGMINAARRSTEAAYGKHSGTTSHSVARTSSATHKTLSSQNSFHIGHDAALSNKIKSQFLEGIRARSSASVAASVSQTFSRKPVHAAYLEAAHPYGLGDSDLRDVATAYMVVNWMIANQAPLPTVAQVKGLRHQLSQSMQQNPPVASEAQRQTAAEQMMYMLVSLIYARQEGQQEHRQQDLSQMSDVIATTFQKKNLNLRDLNLTNKGFVPR
jgi:hypothetical protein